MDPLLLNAIQRRHSNNNPTLMPCNNSGENRISFEAFFTGWLIRQKNYLDRLISAQNNFQNISELELSSLVSQTLTHYQQYYAAKVEAAGFDVFAMFAPPWFSSYELTYLWITGFKPSLAFKILDKSVDQDELTDEQLDALCRLRVETRAAERELNNEMARVQESWGLPPLVNLALKNPAKIRVDGETVHAAMQTLTEEMETLVASADYIRMMTARKIVELLSPVQSVRFLAAATQLQINIRKLGLQRDAERGRGITRSAQE
ncbi:protein DOG1-like 4 [Papaver somniferum]|uniref:protein DOG1-like 4 n=1 Tax=Papaver somniferum TaxID=3469 RepID=UPI000E6F9CD1|nr:protein DOG1-like 4 [Papaver somniferum]